MSRRKPEYWHSVHYIDNKGINRVAQYVSWENMHKGMERMEAKGYEIVAYG